MRYETLELADAVEGDEVYQGGAWVPVERVTVFGSRGDLVSIRFAGGGTMSGPLHHMGKARRPVDDTPELVERVGTLHTPELATYVAELYPAALPLLADGWTLDSALAHVDGTCDIAICTGAHA